MYFIPVPCLRSKSSFFPLLVQQTSCRYNSRCLAGCRGNRGMNPRGSWWGRICHVMRRGRCIHSPPCTRDIARHLPINPSFLKEWPTAEESGERWRRGGDSNWLPKRQRVIFRMWPQHGREYWRRGCFQTLPSCLGEGLNFQRGIPDHQHSPLWEEMGLPYPISSPGAAPGGSCQQESQQWNHRPLYEGKFWQAPESEIFLEIINVRAAISVMWCFERWPQLTYSVVEEVWHWLGFTCDNRTLSESFSHQLTICALSPFRSEIWEGSFGTEYGRFGGRQYSPFHLWIIPMWYL